MEKSIALFVAINFLIIGASHLFRHDAWKEFFALLHSKGRAGALINGCFSLGMGSLIVAFHNVWTGVPIILSLIGWAYLVKSAAIFLFPDWGVRSMAQVQTASQVKFVVAGIAMIGIAAALGVTVWQGTYDQL